MEEEFLRSRDGEKPAILKSDEEPLIWVEEFDSPGPPYFTFAALAWIVVAFTSWRWWWAALLLTLAAAAAYLFRSFKAYRTHVRIYRGGLLTVDHTHPFTKERIFRQLPWSSLLHVDLRGGRFAYHYVGPAESRKGDYLVKELPESECRRVADLLKSHQQRGDIPSTVRIID